MECHTNESRFAKIGHYEAVSLFIKHNGHGLKGTGAVYIGHPKLITPLISGGHDQEYGLRGGTENVLGAATLGVACGEVYNNLEQDIEHYRKLHYRLLKCLKEAFNEDEYHINPYDKNTDASRVVSITLPGTDADTLVVALDIFIGMSRSAVISAGSACRANLQEPSRVLKAIGLSDNEARSTIRVSFSRDNTEEEIHDFVNLLREGVNKLKMA